MFEGVVRKDRKAWMWMRRVTEMTHHKDREDGYAEILGYRYLRLCSPNSSLSCVGNSSQRIPPSLRLRNQRALGRKIDR